MYPLYRFRPVHRKKQGMAGNTVLPLDDPANKRKGKQPTTEEVDATPSHSAASHSSYAAPGIALPSLPSLSHPVSPVGSIARRTQEQQQHQGFLHPFHNPLNDTTPTTNDFPFNAPHAPSPQYAQQAFAPFVQPSAYPSSTLPFGLGRMYTTTPNS